MARLAEAREVLETLQLNDYEEKGWPATLAALSLQDRERVLKQRLFAQEEEKRRLFKELSDLQKRGSNSNANYGTQWQALTFTDIDQLIENLNNTPLPTVYEDPLYYKIVLLLIPYVKRGYEEQTYQKLVERILFGTRPKHDINAQFIEVEKEKSYIIAFQHGLLEFLYKACHILFKFATPPHQFEKSWSMRPDTGLMVDADATTRIGLDASTDMYELVTSMVINDTLEGQSSNYQAKSTETNLIIFNTYVLPMFLFVFHHEISHLVLKHNLEQRSWIDEMQADIMAFQRVLKTLDSRLPVLGIVNAIFSFFDLLEIIERTRSVAATTEEFKDRPDSHPYPPIRKQYIRLIGKVLLKDEPQQLEQVETAYAVSERIFRFIWENIYGALLMRKQLGEELKAYGS